MEYDDIDVYLSPVIQSLSIRLAIMALILLLFYKSFEHSARK